MAHVGTWFCLAALLVGCASEEKCVWGVDELLTKVGASDASREDCGSFNVIEGEKIVAALACLKAAPSDSGAEFTVNYCVDCSIPSTFVRTADAELFEVRMEDDAFGDDKREASVKSCAELVFIENEGIRCVDAEQLYSCSDQR